MDQQRVINKSEITMSENNTPKQQQKYSTKIKTQFTHEEIQLLSKGLKYNLHHKYRKWIETLALEAETAKYNLVITEKNYYRQALAKEHKTHQPER
jgi:hypothetical protein